MRTPTVYLSRRNLLTLLSKLDRTAEGYTSACTIIKRDTNHPTHAQNFESIVVVAVEDEVYYVDRAPGEVHHADVPPTKEKK